MIVYGFAKQYQYAGDGTLKVQVRIPSVDGPYRQTSAREPYTLDKDLPWFDSLLLPTMPADGDVVALASTNDGKSSDFIVIGLTGGNFYNGTRLTGGNGF